MKRFSTSATHEDCPKCGGMAPARGHDVVFMTRGAFHKNGEIRKVPELLRVVCVRCHATVGDFAPLDAKEAEE